jgi:hypothetical protein
MGFQWLEMRIAEERDRRQREAHIFEMLPAALAELHGILEECVQGYTAEFGADSASLEWEPPAIRVSTKEPPASVEIVANPEIPGFDVRRSGGDPLILELGLLPGNKMSYRDRGADQYLNMEEVTRRILDRTLFPKLKE